MTRPTKILTRRIYEPAARGDGRRVLIDRLWPRGLSRAAAGVDFWARAIAPSNTLRKWYQHDPEKWPEFRRRYFAELDANPRGVAELKAALGSGTATLLFSSRETARNNATALREYLEAGTRASARPKGVPRMARSVSPRKTRPAASGRRGVELLIATQKGAFVLKGDPGRRVWKVEGPHLLGCETNHFVRDPRDGKTLLLAAVTGHLGPTVFRSNDRGKTWTEARQPPAFPKTGDDGGPAVKRTFFLAPGHAHQPGVWYAGTVPHALFRSDDGGASWHLVQGFSRFVAALRARKPEYLGETPGGAITHSVLVDPRDARHLYVSLSTGGFFESRDTGDTWRPLNDGVLADFFPEKYPEFGQDPHCAVMSPADPDRLYQQNHCGVYRLDRPGMRWERIGKNLPERVGDIGFPVVAHPRDPDTLWVFPMDGTQVWPRTSPEGRPAVFRSRNGGKTWKRQARGFPPRQGWFTVFRQAMKGDTGDPVGLYLGTTAGEVWASRDEGERWRVVAMHLPRILALEVAER